MKSEMECVVLLSLLSSLLFSVVVSVDWSAVTDDTYPTVPLSSTWNNKNFVIKPGMSTRIRRKPASPKSTVTNAPKGQETGRNNPTGTSDGESRSSTQKPSPKKSGKKKPSATKKTTKKEDGEKQSTDDSDMSDVDVATKTEKDKTKTKTKKKRKCHKESPKEKAEVSGESSDFSSMESDKLEIMLHRKSSSKENSKTSEVGQKGRSSTSVEHTSNFQCITHEEDLTTKLRDAGENLVVIDFFAKWCGPCKMISPKIEQLAKEYPDVVFLKVDVDECEEVATEYDISSMPTFVFVKNSTVLTTFSGANFDKLKETLLKHK